jgi:HAD domain in Swiss Army Knife RNA repair proteins
MHRLLVLDLNSWPPSDPTDQGLGRISWLAWLADALHPFEDVRIVLLTLRSTDLGELEKLLGPLATRVIGMTHDFQQKDGLESALRVDNRRVVNHLIVTGSETELPDGEFNILVCNESLGLSALRAQAVLANWLSSTSPVLRTASGAKVPLGRGQCILYLDFDGVLHHENVLWHHKRGVYAGPPGFTLFEHAGLLDELLIPYPSLRIVLSTSWVRQYGCSGSAKHLPPGLRDRVIGATFHSEMNERVFEVKPRGQQVLEDIARRQPSDWLALDDVNEGWPSGAGQHVVITDERLGISAPGVVDQIAAVLQRMHACAAQ